MYLRRLSKKQAVIIAVVLVVATGFLLLAAGSGRKTPTEKTSQSNYEAAGRSFVTALSNGNSDQITQLSTDRLKEGLANDPFWQAKLTRFKQTGAGIPTLIGTSDIEQPKAAYGVEAHPKRLIYKVTQKNGTTYTIYLIALKQGSTYKIDELNNYR